MTLFIVIHENPETDDFKIIGIYSSRKGAEAGIERVRKLPGFSALPQYFSINEYELDQDQWRQGFATIPKRFHVGRS
ncbi:MAG TPA: hypothetical protein VKB16_14265 [Beijerinckiaceae bacterium]|nr:hypothetical protein [Beijerinckiaceae bacterium]